jgi:EmrB/QacA subfamily drug resistance transporter
VDGISWNWIFWINVPIGLALIPLAARRLTESHGPARHLDLPGLALGGLGLLGIVYGIVRGNELGWTSATVMAAIGAGVVLLAAFAAWELRAPHPMLPMRFFRSRAFAAANGVGFIMSFGVFGSIFLLAPFLQVTQGLSPLEAGIRTLPWTAMPMLVAPVAGILSDRIGSRPLMATGLALQAIAMAWLAAVSTTTVPYAELVLPFILTGAGMALVFAPSANAVLGSVRQSETGQASGATNAIRELGGVMGIAVLAAVFSASGSYESPQAYTDGMMPAVWVGAAVLAVGALVALLIPGRAGRAAAPAPVAAPAPA